jgi:gluconokinase
MPSVLVVMGVAGAGKSTVGRALAERLGWRYLEADDLHSPANVEKMRSGTPLTDADRAPWLAAVAEVIGGWLAQGASGVAACSALKRAYRERLAGGRDEVRFVYLEGSEATLRARLEARRGHYFPPALLASQLADLEPPAAEEGAIVVSVESPLEAQVAAIVAALEEGA